MRRPSLLSRIHRTFYTLSSGLGDAGATVIEYGIIACIIALGIIAGAQVAGGGLNNMFQLIGASLDTASNAASGSVSN